MLVRAFGGRGAQLLQSPCEVRVDAFGPRQAGAAGPIHRVARLGITSPPWSLSPPAEASGPVPGGDNRIVVMAYP